MARLPKRTDKPFTPGRRIELFDGQARLDWIHETYADGRIIEGERLAACTWNYDRGEIRGVAVFEKARSEFY